MGPRPALPALLVCFAAYLLAAAFGRWMMVVPDLSITLWLPNGVILGVLLVQPRLGWPWWIAVAVTGELSANAIWFHNPLGPALGYVVANVSEVLVGALMLRPYFSGPSAPLSTLRQVVAFLGLGAVLAPVVGATLISAIDALIGKNAFQAIWPFLWLGDATGILIATPLVVCAVGAWRTARWPTPGHLLEAAIIALLLGGFSVWHLSTGLPNAFLLCVPILWAALRFQLAGTSLAVLMLAILIGYFAQMADPALLGLQNAAFRHAILEALVIVAASMGLIVAATLQEQRNAVAQLAAANTLLEQRVADRTSDIEAAERRFRAIFENAAVGIAVLDTKGTLVRVNDAMAQMLGYRVQDIEGQPLDRFTHPEDRQKGQAAMDRLRRGEADTYDVEKRYLTQQGETLWGHTSVSCVRTPGGDLAYSIKVIQNITDSKSAEEVRQLLMREVNHRSKNMLATVQAIARQTSAGTPQNFMKNFSNRLQALAANQDLLVRSGWKNIDLNELIRSQLGHFAALLNTRIVIEGPALAVPPSAAQAIGMAIHELGTNAAKYGALSNEQGRVTISWGLHDDTFSMEWRERGGPAVQPPDTKGFGTKVLDGMVRATLNGEVIIDYAPTGLVWTLRCPLAALKQEKTIDGPV